MTDKLTTRTYDIDPRELTLLTKNARRMSQRQFKQLVENVKRDGVLTSQPLVHRGEDGKLLVLSGNHRTKAAIAAALPIVTVMEVFGDNLDAERLMAIQLSHNAISGEDDQNILAELYQSLGVMGKLYSGLTDEDFGGVADLDLSKLTIGAPRYEEVTLMFLPEDREVFIAAMEKLGKGAAKTQRYIGRLADFEGFERALVAVQDTLGIHNQALAIEAMSTLALERLHQLEGANGDEGGQSPTDREQSSDEATVQTPARKADNKRGGVRAARNRRHPGGSGAEAAG